MNTICFLEKKIPLNGDNKSQAGRLEVDTGIRGHKSTELGQAT